MDEVLQRLAILRKRLLCPPVVDRGIAVSQLALAGGVREEAAIALEAVQGGAKVRLSSPVRSLAWCVRLGKQLLEGLEIPVQSGLAVTIPPIHGGKNALRGELSDQLE